MGTLDTIVFLGCNKAGSSKDAIEAAEQLKFHTVLLTNRQSFLRNQREFPHVHDMLYVDLDDDNAILEGLQKLKYWGLNVRAVVSFTDAHVATAARISEQLNLPAQTVHAIDNMLNKIAMRELLSATPHAVPYQILRPELWEATLDLRLPVVVKSPRSTGSKDVLLANSLSEFKGHVQDLWEKYPDSDILVEEYVPGQQHLAEVLVHEGEAHVVAVVEQQLSLERRFIVTGYCVHPKLSEDFQRDIEEMAETVRRVTGMQQGAFHVEFKATNHGCKIIEVNPRISGAAMNRLISYAFGINLAKETIRSLLGEPPHLRRKKEKYAYAQYLTVNHTGKLSKVTGRVRAMKSPLVKEVYVKPRKEAVLSTPRSMGDRYAYVITAGRSAQEVCAAAQKAAGYIQFHTTPIRRGRR